MKRWLAVGSTMIALLAGAVIWHGDGEDTVSADALTEQVVGVDALMRNVERFRSGPVTVEGVVSATDADRQSLALIDVAEFRACATANCATLVLPVHWSGRMPEMASFVQTEGEVLEREDGLVFVAKTLKEKALDATALPHSGTQG